MDHFIPGFGVDPATSGSAAHIGLYYYFYPQASCSLSTCKLEAGFVSSAQRKWIYVGAGTLAAVFSLVVGLVFLFDVSNVLPSLN